MNHARKTICNSLSSIKLHGINHQLITNHIPPYHNQSSIILSAFQMNQAKIVKQTSVSKSPSTATEINDQTCSKNVDVSSHAQQIPLITSASVHVNYRNYIVLRGVYKESTIIKRKSSNVYFIACIIKCLFYLVFIYHITWQ